MRRYLEFWDFQGDNLQGKSFYKRFKTIDDIEEIDKDTLINAKFSGAKLQGADFQRVYLYGAAFQGANLTNAILKEANLRGVQFQGAILINADLQSADIHECNFKGAKLHGANLKACKDYHIANWTEAEYDSKTQFPKNFEPEEYGLKETTKQGQPVTTNMSQQSLDETYINIQKALREIKTSLQKRQGQKTFREALMKYYKRRCAITGCEIEEVLEAAHVKPYCISKENKPENGILLRADLHTLFDLNLIIIHPYTKIIEVSQSLPDGNEYEQFNNIVLPSYEQDIYYPHDEYLEWRYEHYEEYIGKSLRKTFLTQRKRG